MDTWNRLNITQEQENDKFICDDTYYENMNIGVSEHLLDAKLTMIRCNSVYRRLFDTDNGVCQYLQEHYPTYMSDLCDLYRYNNDCKHFYIKLFKENNTECCYVLDAFLTNQYEYGYPNLCFLYTEMNHPVENKKKSYLSSMIAPQSEVVYISDTTDYHLLYLNRDENDRSISIMENFEKHKTCYEVLHNKTEPCVFCPIQNLKEKDICTWRYYDTDTKQVYKVDTSLIQWKTATVQISILHPLYTQSETAISKFINEESFLNILPCAVARLSLNLKKVLWHNKSFLNLIGYTKKQFETELGGQFPIIGTDEINGALNKARNLKHTEDSIKLSLKIQKRNGEQRFWYALLIYVSRTDSSDDLASLYIIGFDITMKQALCSL